MKYPENIEAIKSYNPDYMGFIFYEKSPRYVTENTLSSMVIFNGNPQTIGVFVNSPIKEVIKIATKYNLDFVQLHGNESVAYAKELLAANIKIIKAFQIKEGFDWLSINNYTPYVDYFLFDTATKNYGGSGLKFNWEQLSNYKEKTPFFLSGGITTNDVQKINNLNIPQLYAIDINSKFETEPGIKDIELVKKMIKEVRNETNIPSK